MKKTLIFFALVIVAAIFIFIVYQVKTISGTQSNDGDRKISETTISAYVDNCARCHGNSGEGFGENPAIINTSLSTDEIKGVIQNGLAKMPAFQNIKDPVLSEMAEYVSNL